MDDRTPYVTWPRPSATLLDVDHRPFMNNQWASFPLVEWVAECKWETLLLLLKTTISELFSLPEWIPNTISFLSHSHKNTVNGDILQYGFLRPSIKYDSSVVNLHATPSPLNPFPVIPLLFTVLELHDKVYVSTTLYQSDSQFVHGRAGTGKPLNVRPIFNSK